MIGHLVVDQREGVIARTSGVGSDQETPISLATSSGEHGNCSLHGMYHITIFTIYKRKGAGFNDIHEVSLMF